MIRVAYHYPCTDGGFAALSAYLYYSSALFTPFDHRYKEEKVASILDSFTASDTVYLLDFCLKKEDLKKLAAKVSKVIIIDHHKSTDEVIKELKKIGELPENLEIVFSFDHSAAFLTFEYFEKKAPNFLDCYKTPVDREKLTEKILLVEDNDLWRHKIANSKEFAAGIKDLNLEYDMEKDDYIMDRLLAIEVEATVTRGEVVLLEEAEEIEKLLKNKFIFQFNGVSMFVVKTQKWQLTSLLGNKLAEASRDAGMSPVGAVCSNVDDKVKVSLRSVDGFDCEVIAKALGGSGHADSCGFMTDNKGLFSL
jgi:oligoribonuclease NrnB/cAMP/cGMP phosphodiesterase (DHH superfamily)